MIATMNPSPSAVEETKSTLKFAQRVKKVVLKAMVNEVVGDKALIHKYQSTVRLISLLMRQRQGTDRFSRRIQIIELQERLKIATAAANSPSMPSTPSDDPRRKVRNLSFLALIEPLNYNNLSLSGGREPQQGDREPPIPLPHEWQHREPPKECAFSLLCPPSLHTMNQIVTSSSLSSSRLDP